MAKSVSSKTALSAQSIIEKADALVKQRENFEQNEYARSNQRLYEILAQVLEMYEQASISKTTLSETVKQMKAKLEASKVRVQTNTLALTLFVRYVFRTDRQRSMNYSRTLQAALQQGINAKQLAQFVEDCGGVEQCKKRFTKSEKVVAKETVIANNLALVDDTLASLAENPLATFKVPNSVVATTYDKEFVFVIGKADKQGNIKALGAVPAYSAGMAKWAKQQLALFISNQQAITKKHANAKRKDTALATAKSAAKSKTPTETVGELLAA
ncbi:hypothetical protein [Polynucleobacter corsicus]|uniref:hypothetical protein n=1 Tax=Polynucleobacter corsicus TaxID=2081042 RepID=UPI001BFE5A69|nr:hypothetical protein [Polynucleobacter corsicus]QWE18667.1 hypothetical protein C2747_10375 [Polynucleobacter corsicus]